MAKMKPSANTVKKARAMAAASLETACTIYSMTKTDDGYEDVDVEGLRDTTTCRVTKLGDQMLTDSMRARNAAHFAVALPALCEIAVGERIKTTWSPDGSDTENLVLEVVEFNTPRQTPQIVIEAIAFKVT